MAATPWASDRNWELVFEDDFDGSSPVSYTHLTLPTT